MLASTRGPDGIRLTPCIRVRGRVRGCSHTRCRRRSHAWIPCVQWPHGGSLRRRTPDFSPELRSPTTTAQGFVHRTKGDDLTMEACNRCYLTVTSAKHGYDLLQDESKHQCSGSVGVRHFSPDKAESNTEHSVSSQYPGYRGTAPRSEDSAVGVRRPLE